MNRGQWEVCRDPAEMLRWLRDQGVSPRKYRLFGCACVRRLGRVFEEYALDWRPRVERVEQLADGPPEQSSAWRPSGWVPGPQEPRTVLAHLEAEPSPTQAWELVEATAWLMEARSRFWSRGSRATRYATRPGSTILPDSPWAGEAWRTQADLLRDLFGHFFHADPQWTARLSRADEAAAIARGIYDEHAFAEMPVLGDALEDAGCTDDEVLAHCRQGAEHARGCWVIDAILGRS